MRARDMLRIGHQGFHSCAPKEWRRTPILTGDSDFDETVHHRANKDMIAKLNQHIAGGKKNAYGGLTAYSGYANYHGDS